MKREKGKKSKPIQKWQREVGEHWEHEEKQGWELNQLQVGEGGISR